MEVEIERITDVERENHMSLLDDFVGNTRQIPDSVADVLESGCGGDFAGLSERHEEILPAEKPKS